MKTVTIFNNVLGPVMRGPSSSHTAASYHIGRSVRDIIAGGGKKIKKISISFDERGSYGAVYREQGSDLGFISGLMGWDILDERFRTASESAAAAGADISFTKGRFDGADHPNWVLITAEDSSGHKTEVVGASVGGGSFIIKSVDGWRTGITGDSFCFLVSAPREEAHKISLILGSPEPPQAGGKTDRVFF